MPTGDELVKLAMQHVGEPYILGANVPLDNPQHRGPWDCAEFVSWAVYQISNTIIGCTDNAAQMHKLEPYSGAWARDGERSGILLSVEQVTATRGGILVRRPRHETSGHVAISRGDGTTIEAMDSKHDVTVGKIAGRRWDVCFRLPVFS